MAERIGRHPFELVAATIALTIAAHLPHLPAWLWLGSAVAIGVRVYARRQSARAVPIWLRVPAAAVLLAAVVLHYGNVFGREPGSALGCGLLALKLLETERARDARVAMGFAGFILMSALLFQQTLLFTFGASAVLVLLLAALVSLQPAPLDPRQSLRGELRLGATLLAAGLPLAAAGFLLIPRLTAPLWGTVQPDAPGRTGLSETMAPGALSELLTDDTPAFRVQFEGSPPPPQQRYFRAIVMWDFDGATWTHGRHNDFLRPEQISGDSGRFDYSIQLEPTDRRWLPALDLPLAPPPSARMTPDRVLIANEPALQVREYRVSSAARYALAPELNPYERSRALALPEGFDPKTRELAAGWRSSGIADAAIVRAALDMFGRDFIYTLNPPLLGRDGVDDFLFSTQKGYCEHYASAFVVLMRAANVPARVVTGYQGGWWNATANYLLVRNSDAHAWAEVWLSNRGWVRIDPTAAVSPTRIELGASAANDAPGWSQAAWLRALRNQFDLVNGLWARAVIRFDAFHQKGLLTTFGVPSANEGDLLIAFSIALGTSLLLATLWAMRGSARRPRGDALDHAWRRLRARLAGAGVDERASEGPLDFLSRARKRMPASADALGRLVTRYVALRYGALAPEPEQVRSFARDVRNFRVPRKVDTAATDPPRR